MTVRYATPVIGLTPPEPERRLLAAIIARACRDLTRNDRNAEDAAAYVASANFTADCALLGYDAAAAREALSRYSARTPRRNS